MSDSPSPAPSSPRPPASGADMAARVRRFTALVTESGYATPAHLADAFNALAQQNQPVTPPSLGQTLIAQGHLTPGRLAALLGDLDAEAESPLDGAPVPARIDSADYDSALDDPIGLQERSTMGIPKPDFSALIEPEPAPLPEPDPVPPPAPPSPKKSKRADLARLTPKEYFDRVHQAAADYAEHGKPALSLVNQVLRAFEIRIDNDLSPGPRNLRAHEVLSDVPAETVVEFLPPEKRWERGEKPGAAISTLDASGAEVTPPSDLETMLDMSSSTGSGEALKKSSRLRAASLQPAEDFDTTPGARVTAPPADRYILEGEIARGGMGVILLAYDQDLRRRVAMKIIKPKRGLTSNQLERFVQEAQVTGQLEHPNIVPVHEAGVTTKGYLFFTMKYVNGKPFNKIIRAVHTNDPVVGRTFTLPRLLESFLKVCDAVAFAHTRGVVHRDLKPENVMLGSFGEVLVMDWGLARVMRRLAEGKSIDTDDVHVTTAGQVLGTPNYMAPEQARGDVDQIDGRTDVFALGAMLYEILVGRPPFEGGSVWEILIKIERMHWTPAIDAQPGVPAELDRIIKKAMAHAKADRYPTVDALIADVRAFLDRLQMGRLTDAAPTPQIQHGVVRVKSNWIVPATISAIFSSAITAMLAWLLM